MDDLFSFERLDVYRKALELATKVQGIIREVRGNRTWCDQFNRAVISIVLNIAEGASRWHKNDKRNFYFIARGSSFECIPLIDLGVSSRIITDNQREELRSDLRAICQMLTKLIQSLEKEV